MPRPNFGHSKLPGGSCFFCFCSVPSPGDWFPFQSCLAPPQWPDLPPGGKIGRSAQVGTRLVLRPGPRAEPRQKRPLNEAPSEQEGSCAFRCSAQVCRNPLLSDSQMQTRDRRRPTHLKEENHRKFPPPPHAEKRI